MKQEHFHGLGGEYSPPSRRYCEACAQDRIFQNFKCLTCGTVRAAVPYKPKAKPLYGFRRLRYQGLLKQGNRDKRAAFHAAAEASRAKFESQSSAKCPQSSAPVCQVDSANADKVE